MTQRTLRQGRQGKADGPAAGRFLRREEGAALVEFAISLPLMLVLIFLTVESTRLFWSYQAAIAGVRDATRYLARIAPADLCTSGGSVAGYADRLKAIVATPIDGGALHRSGVSVTALRPALDCVTGLGLREASVPVVSVSADLSISLPFAQILQVVGLAPATAIVTTIRDQARVYGL